MGMKRTKILVALLVVLLLAIIWFGVKSNHNDEQNDYVVETPSIEEEQANISKFHADNFNMAIDTAIWTEHHYDAGSIVGKISIDANREFCSLAKIHIDIRPNRITLPVNVTVVVVEFIIFDHSSVFGI